MAGRAWVSQISSLTVLKRQTLLAQNNCTPNYVPITSCIGDCHNAYQTYSQSPYTCTDLPQLKSISCSQSMPCVCSINSYDLDPSVATCGDCTATPEGQRCFLVCRNKGEVFNSTSVHSLLCMATGWSSLSPLEEPKCSFPIPTCPNIVTTNGLVTNHTSKCLGAFQGQVCEASCLPGYYSPTGWFNTTCTLQADGSLNWSRPLLCQCQGCGEFGDPFCPKENTLFTNIYNPVFQ
jgi:hypothetical protein